MHVQSGLGRLKYFVCVSIRKAVLQIAFLVGRLMNVVVGVLESHGGKSTIGIPFVDPVVDLKSGQAIIR